MGPCTVGTSHCAYGDQAGNLPNLPYTFLVFCTVGGRSGRSAAALYLHSHGFRDVAIVLAWLSFLTSLNSPRQSRFCQDLLTEPQKHGVHGKAQLGSRCEDLAQPISRCSWQVNSSQMKSILGGWRFPGETACEAPDKTPLRCNLPRHCRLGARRRQLGGHLGQPDAEGESLVPGSRGESSQSRAARGSRSS